MHVPVGEAADIKKREPHASKRPTASPGSLVSGTVLHVLADHATVQLDNGERSDIQSIPLNHTCDVWVLYPASCCHAFHINVHAINYHGLCLEISAEVSSG